MVDITMSLDDTLELDTIIEESSSSNMLNVTDGTKGTDFNLSGIDTHTDIFDPINSGTYTLDVNGQKLTVKVTDPSTIPDGVAVQFTSNNYTDGDSTWIDNAGENHNADFIDASTSNQDGSEFNAGTLPDGSAAITNPNNDGYASIPFPMGLSGSSLESNVAFEFAIGSPSETYTDLFGNINNLPNRNQSLLLQLNRNEKNNNDNGNFAFQLVDKNANGVLFAPSTNVGFNDGNRHNITVIINELNQSTPSVDCIVDGTNVDLSYHTKSQVDNFGNWGSPLNYWARYDDGSSIKIGGPPIGASRLWASAPDGQTIDQYPF